MARWTNKWKNTGYNNMIELVQIFEWKLVVILVKIYYKNILFCFLFDMWYDN